MAWALVRFRRLEQALRAIDHAVALSPDEPRARSLRALVHSRLGSPSSALADISDAIRLRPDHDGDLHNRAVIFTSLGRYREAIEDYRRVLALAPDSAGTHNNLAWLLATCPDAELRDGACAVEHAQAAVAIAHHPPWLDTLAAAWAEHGDFENAAVVAEQAYALSSPKNASFLERAALYKNHQAYRIGRPARDD